MRAGLAAKPKDIRDDYAALDAYAEQGVTHEGALRSAFQHLLAETGRRAGWTLIPELTLGKTPWQSNAASWTRRSRGREPPDP